MTNSIWTTGVSGNWNRAANWTGGRPTASNDAVINPGSTYTVTISSADVAQSLTVDATDATLLEKSAGGLTMSGALTLDAGTLILNGANDFGGGTSLFGGTLELGNAAALGTERLTINSGTLIGTTNETLSNTLAAGGTLTIAAAHGRTVTLSGQATFNMHSGDVISVGQSGDDGTIVWNPLTLGVSGSGYSVDVNAGTLSDANGRLSTLLSATSSTDVAAGAKIDIRGHAETIGHLNGGGTVTSTVAGGALTLDGGDFSGVIAGKLSLTVDGVETLTNTSTYTGGTTIDPGATLLLEGAGAVSGKFTDNGALELNYANNSVVELDKAISGSGALELDNGTFILDGHNSYSGGTTIDPTGGFAMLEIGNAAGAGSGEIDMGYSARLRGTATETLHNQLAITGSGVSFFAAHDTTLTLNAGKGWKVVPLSVDFVFGRIGDDGVIVWKTPAGSSMAAGGHDSVEVGTGTLQAGDSNFQLLFQHGSLQIDPHGTVDVAGFATEITSLGGFGTLENTGALATVTIDSGTYYGAITGAITLDIAGAVTFSGPAEDYGTINLLANANLLLNASAESTSDIVFAPGAHAVLTLVNSLAGEITGFDDTDTLALKIGGANFKGISYSGDTSGGTLTATFGTWNVQINFVGDYTNGSFTFSNEGIVFVPSSSAAIAHPDTFDFGTAAHAAPEPGVTHLHGGHDANEVAFGQDVTEALHAHDHMLDHFAQGLFAHGHAIAEALA